MINMSNVGLRAQPREDTGLSLTEAVFGAQIVLPNEFLQNLAFFCPFFAQAQF
jgi:hypothetical protein